MECERFISEKLLLAHGELDRAPDLQTHLAQCVGCRADVEEMREVARRYREASSEAMPAALRERILAIPPLPRRPPMWQRAWPAVAAAVLLAVLAFLLFGPSERRAPDLTANLPLEWAPSATAPAPMAEEPAPISLPAFGIDDRLRALKERIDIPKENEW
ncbi:MAG: hypothetical protein HYY16_15595 [Planctomycetes bacterium]|nr:hypothetical protein [Planctomycetota bacterium]